MKQTNQTPSDKYRPNDKELREKQRKDDDRQLWKAYLRIASGKATCTSCTCCCKNNRGGRCGMFTPTKGFYETTRAAFETRRRTR
jgi:hypothetical protein